MTPWAVWWLAQMPQIRFFRSRIRHTRIRAQQADSFQNFSNPCNWHSQQPCFSRRHPPKNERSQDQTTCQEQYRNPCCTSKSAPQAVAWGKNIMSTEAESNGKRRSSLRSAMTTPRLPKGWSNSFSISKDFHSFSCNSLSAHSSPFISKSKGST